MSTRWNDVPCRRGGMLCTPTRGQRPYLFHRTIGSHLPHLPQARNHGTRGAAGSSSATADFEDGVGERIRGFLREVVTDAALDTPVGVFA